MQASLESRGVDTTRDVHTARPGIEWRREPTASRHPDLTPAAIVAPQPTLTPAQRRRRQFAALASRWRYPLSAYALSRAILLVVLIVDSVLQHRSLLSEIANWDGLWYLTTTVHWYPHVVLHEQTTLGFLPLYPVSMWLVGHALTVPYVISGLIISLVAGAAATVLIARLAEGWFGTAAARRAILFFCLFPGSVVFSMVYTEGLTLLLVAGSLLALERRRWVLAGVLAGLATACDPVGLAIIPACVAVAGREVYVRGWRDREARRSLLAPLLSALGLVGFGIFLWFWTGTPLASYKTQHATWGWSEHTSPLALFWTARKLVDQIFSHHSWAHPGINLNLLAGLLGAIFLIYGLRVLWQMRSQVSLGALVWTAGIAVLTLTSDQTPPNARMLLCAFPVVLVVAARLRGRNIRWLIAGSTVLLVAMSFVSFVGTGLRP